MLEKDFAFFLLKRPKLKLGHKDPLLGKLNFMSDNVESLFKYRNLEVRLFNIPVARNAFSIIDDARAARNSICHSNEYLKNADMALAERAKLAKLQQLVRCEVRHMKGKRGNY